MVGMLNEQLRLGVNVDHVATLRQARGTTYPDPVIAAELALQAGASAITVHLREDRRHIQERDVRAIRALPNARLNLEMAATEAMLEFALSVAPDDCCLVPENRQELTTEGGLDVVTNQAVIGRACRALGAGGIRVSLFIDAVAEQVDAAIEAGAPVIEIHTGSYAEFTVPHEIEAELERISSLAHYAHTRGLQVNAGHGLTVANVGPIAAIEQLVELNIGHSIVAHALFVGMETAVAEMLHAMNIARGGT